MRSIKSRINFVSKDNVDLYCAMYIGRVLLDK